MKTEELKKLLGDAGTDEVINAIMAMNGKDIESHKKSLTDAETARDQFKTQLDAANQSIEGFKGMKKPEEVDAAVAEWKTKFEQAQTEAQTQLKQVKFDHALENALASAKVRNVKTILPLLNREKLILQDDGTITGLDDQLKPIKEQNDYLFEGEKKDPKLVLGGNNQPIATDAFEAAMLKGAGFKTSESQEK